MLPKEHLATCPLAAIDRRLEDVHQQWHQAEAVYFNPDRFRTAIQTAIQTLRTVTFIIQSNKRLIPDFDTWYAGWQERLKAEPLMRWMVDARNKIEKQGDLETYSFVKAEIIASYLEEGPVIEVPAQLFDAPWKLLKSIPRNDLGEHVRKHGALKIQRRWIENSLPDYELLDAVAIAYGRISEVVSDAHRQLGLEPPTVTDTETGRTFEADARGGRLPCMIGHADARALVVSISNGRPISLGRKSVKLNKSKIPDPKARYGINLDEAFGDDLSDIEHIAKGLFKTAQKMFLKDGYHETMLFLYKGSKLVNLLGFRAEEHGEKYLLMREIAHEVTKSGADGVISISEVWTATFDPSNPYRRAGEAPDREEALTVTLVRKEGVPLQISAKINRLNSGLEFSETRVQHDATIMLFAPIYHAWGRPIPDRWLEDMAPPALRGGR